jgi:predicted nucleotidyltransferase
MRSIPDTFDPAAVAEIDARLRSIEASHDVSIPLAIESGSRAWGFPSPDSDYDCRFVFVRRANAYISPWQQRDVIETPLVGDIDANGWELSKTLRLLLKGNAVIVEWLRSPLSYCGEETFRDEFVDLARRVADRDLIGRHYLHLGDRQRRVYFGDGSEVAQKKIFYALRPAATLRWMRLHLGAAVAPMHFPTLMAECEPPADVAATTAELVAAKMKTREMGVAPVPHPISVFIDSELDRARETFDSKRAKLSAEAQEEVRAFFLRTVKRLDGARFA